MNLKENKEGHMSVFWGRRGKERKKCHNNSIILKNIDRKKI